MASAESRVVAGVDGWTRRFMAMGSRLNEAVELYRALGYDVRLEPPTTGRDGLPDKQSDVQGQEEGPSDSCAGCFVMTLARTIYTRPATGNRDGKRHGEREE